MVLVRGGLQVLWQLCCSKKSGHLLHFLWRLWSTCSAGFNPTIRVVIVNAVGGGVVHSKAVVMPHGINFGLGVGYQTSHKRAPVLWEGHLVILLCYCQEFVGCITIHFSIEVTPVIDKFAYVFGLIFGVGSHSGIGLIQVCLAKIWHFIPFISIIIIIPRDAISFLD